MSLFEKKFTFISTGDKKGFYTLRVYGNNRINGKNASAFIRNLSTDKDKAIIKARLLSEELGLPLNEEIDSSLTKLHETKLYRSSHQSKFLKMHL